jgi:hypothetical protein
VTDWQGIDGLRLQVEAMQSNRDLDVNVRILAELVAGLCAALHVQGIDSLSGLEKQVMYLKHLGTQRGEMWDTLEQLAGEVRLVREQLVDRAAHLDEREQDIERREQQLHENAQLLIDRLDGKAINWLGES